MSDITTAKFHDSEISKSDDFNYAAGAPMNVLHSIIDGAFAEVVNSFVISGLGVGQATPPSMNLVVAPGLAYSRQEDKLLHLGANLIVSVAASDPALDRIDTIEARFFTLDIDPEIRAFKDPSTGAVSYANVFTKVQSAMEVRVVSGVPGSGLAPDADAGWMKLAEVQVVAGATELISATVRGLTAAKDGAENTAWTAQKTASFMLGSISALKKYLLDHEAKAATSVVSVHGIRQGHNNGFDADTLDGQHGSYYLPLSAYTALDILDKLKTVDGAGSGLDADLLEGMQPASAATPSTVMQRGADGRAKVAAPAAADDIARLDTVEQATAWGIKNANEALLPNRRVAGKGNIQLGLPANPAEGTAIDVCSLEGSVVIKQSSNEAIIISQKRDGFVSSKGTSGGMKLMKGAMAHLIYAGVVDKLTSVFARQSVTLTIAGVPQGSAWSPNGRYLVIVTQATPYLFIFDMITGTPELLPSPAVLPTGASYEVSWSPDGRYMAVAFTGPASTHLVVYDWASGSPVAINLASQPPAGVAGCDWSDDGRYLTVCFAVSPYILTYDWISGSPVVLANPATLPAGNVRGVRWSHNSRYLAIGEDVSPYVAIYDWASGVPVKIANPATLPTGYGKSIAWSPDNRYMACVHGTTPFITIYDWISGAPVKITNPATLPASTPQAVSWSPDGRLLVVAHNNTPFITIYDWKTGLPVKAANPATLPAGHGYGPSWAPGGEYFFVGNVNATPYTNLYSLVEKDIAMNGWVLFTANEDSIYPR